MQRRLTISAITGFIAMAIACGGHGHSASVLPAPTPAVPNPPSISCPQDLSAEAHVGRLPTVSFDVPATQDGQAPVNVTCTPAAGSEFPVGKTTVTCEAADGLARKASCSFTVVVADIPRIERTRFMAFGDSITEGKISLQTTSPSAPNNYADKLSAQLAARYELQTIVMVKEPESGEPTGSGKYRFQAAFGQAKPEVVTLLEGTNDILGSQDKGTIDSAVEALQNMVQFAKAHGARVFIGTLPPMNPSVFPLAGPAAAVPVLNARIKSMGAAEGITVVDLEAAVPLSLIGPDGKHPTPQGHQKIADAFFEAIKRTLEVKTSTPQ